MQQLSETLVEVELQSTISLRHQKGWLVVAMVRTDHAYFVVYQKPAPLGLLTETTIKLNH